jgi:hypothetical protein
MTVGSYTGGGQTVAVGETIDLDDAEAARIVGLGVAKFVDEPAPAEPAPPPPPRKSGK